MISFKQVQEVPNFRRTNNNLQVLLEEFYTRNIQYAEVLGVEEHYKHPTIARGVISTSVKRSGLPIKVRRRANKVYLVRTDM
jgi:hypothetical protein